MRIIYNLHNLQLLQILCSWIFSETDTLKYSSILIHSSQEAGLYTQMTWRDTG
jgi:hypothetical protein